MQFGQTSHVESGRRTVFAAWGERASNKEPKGSAPIQMVATLQRLQE